eukprot:3122130-Prymnesium_polylepis.1
MAWDDQALRDPGRQIGQPQPRELNRRGIIGALQTVVEPPTDATLRHNAAEHHTVGDRHPRAGGAPRPQAFIAETPGMSVGNALHPTLYHTGHRHRRLEVACSQLSFFSRG